MHPSYHDYNKLLKATTNQISKNLKNSGFNVFHCLESEQKIFLEDFEETCKKKIELLENIEQQEVVLNELEDKKKALMNIMDLENKKKLMLDDALGINLSMDTDDAELEHFISEINVKIVKLKEMLETFTSLSSMRILGINGGNRFLFWNLKQDQPNKEFWVDVYLQDGKLKMGEISDKLNGHSNLIKILETHQNLSSFLKSIRQNFKSL